MTEIVVHAPDELLGAAADAAAALRSALERLGAPAVAEVALVLADDQELARLNETFRGIAEPTDVLSFVPRSAHLPPSESGYLGDIVISVPFAERNAAAAGRDLASELRLLAVHGLLHLLGHDDEDEAGAEAMYRLELELGVREAS